ncbi:hypothetical protein JCM5353_006461 [Sporobolomyces roseus]
MDVQITLTTSDDPPVSLPISRSALVAQSKVFADMLSLDLKADETDDYITLEESAAVVRPFVLMAEGREDELKEALSKVDEKGWLALATFGDKYDSWGMRNLVVLKGWELHSTSKLPLLAFALATATSNDTLIKATAKEALLDPGLEKYSAISSFWRFRLKAWQAQHLDKILRTLGEYSDRATYSCSCRPEDCAGDHSWHVLVGLGLRSYTSKKEQVFSLRNRLRDVKMCDYQKSYKEEDVAKFERDISQWAEFPV